MKEKIIRATATMMTKNGANAVSIRAICEEVGITAPTLYYYFEDRADLLNKVVLRAFKKNSDSSVIVKSDDPIQNVRMLWDDYIAFAVNEPELYSIILMSIAKGEIPDYGMDCFKQTIKCFKDAEEKKLINTSAIEAAFIYQGAAQGVTTLIQSKMEPQYIETISKKTREIVLKGLLA